MFQSSGRRLDRLWTGALFAGLSLLFWLGRSRSFGPGDSAQHVISGLLWAVPHPPGYPLQTALGWAWSRLPWSDPGSAINGLSGILHAAAAALLFLLLRRAGARRAAALTGAALMALSPLFWYYSLVAEVRALNDLLALGAAALAFDWAERGRPGALLVFGLVFGLGMSHHPTFILLAPAYAVWIFSRRPAWRLLAACAGLALAGLAAPYALLGLRLNLSAPGYNLFEVRGWGDLPALYLRKNLGGPLRMVAGSGFLGFGELDAGRLLRHAGWLLSSLWTHAGPAGLALAAAGAAALWKNGRRAQGPGRRELATWGLWFGVSAGVFLIFSSQQITLCDQDYARAVVTRFHLLPLIAVFALAGLGAEALAQRARAPFSAALAAAVFVLPLALRPLSLAGQDPLLDYARGLVRDAAPGDLVVLAADDSIFATLDLELVRREAGGRVFLIPSMFAFPPYVRSLRARHPELALPPIGLDGLSTDWAIWKKLNPGRAVLAEASLRDALLRLYAHSVPQGTLMRIESSPASSDPAADARRFLGSPEIFSWTRARSREWTQENYVLHSRRLMAEWIGSRLDPARNQDLIRRLVLLMNDL